MSYPLRTLLYDLDQSGLFLTWNELSYLAAILIGSAIALFLWIVKGQGRPANRLLVLSMLTVFLLVAGQIMAKTAAVKGSRNWGMLFVQMSWVTGPLVYLYVRKITNPIAQFLLRDCWHFLALLVAFSVYSGLVITGTQIGQWLFNLFEVLGFISVLFYLYRSRLLIKEFYRAEKFYAGDRIRHTLKWLELPLSLFAFFWICRFPLTVCSYWEPDPFLSSQGIVLLNLLMMSIMIWMGANALLRTVEGTPSMLMSKPRSAAPDMTRQKTAWLKQMIKGHRYYLDPELSLNSLAERLNLSVHELSRIINTGLKKNFNDLINEYRVAEVTRKIQDPACDHLTLLGIAFDSGFNSKTTFNRVFKEIRGISALEFKNTLEKQRPSYNSGRHPATVTLISNRQPTSSWFDQLLDRSAMFRNHLKIAWRHLWKDRRYTLLNLVGLSSGLACVLLIYLWVNDELQVDRFNINYKLIYQVLKNDPDPAGIQTSEHTPGLLAAALPLEQPGVAFAASVVPAAWFNTQGLLSVGENHVRSDEAYVSRDFFRMFSVGLLSGNETDVLPDPYAVAISDELAMKVFHTTENLIGKTISWNMEGLGTDLSGTFHISAVFRSLPVTSSLKSDLLFNYDLFLRSRPNLQRWGNSDPDTYVQLKPNADVAQFNNRLHDYLAGKLGVAKGSKEYADMPVLFAQRFSDRYLYGKYENGQAVGGRIQYVRLFTVVAIFILLIACINFMNLSTAKASRRLKEVGIKKVVGASRGSLMLQYFMESVLMAFLSLVLALLLAFVLLPQFNGITGKQLAFSFEPALLLTIIGITLLTGIIAGSYPAFYLSGFKPVHILAGKLPSSWSELWIRKGLVIFQFSLSVVFIVGVLVVYRQMDLLQTKDLGYKRDNVITFKKEGALKSSLQAFLADVRNTPGVTGASSSLGDLTGKHGTTTELLWKKKPADLQTEFSGMYVDYDWIGTLGLKVLEGRAFSAAYPSDSTAIIFNESAIKTMGLKNPVGQRVMLFGKFKTIVGVVKDFNFESLYQGVKPCFITLFQQGVNIEVKIRGGSEQATLSKMDILYKKYNPGVPFDYRFLDSTYQAMYASEQRVAVLSKYFAALAVIISCLGLFGLAAFTARRRQKEIGIRKIVGAGSGSIVLLLSKEFLILVGIAILVAFPVAWFIVAKWLNNFAYRVSMGAGLFVVAGAATILIAGLTVAYQALRAAWVNPVTSIRE